MKSFLRQTGITTVETAIVGVVVFITLFGVIEIGRLLFVYNFLEEATRRGARMAAVCTLNDSAIGQAAAFNPGSNGNSPLVNGLTSANFIVEYLDLNGVVIGDAAGNYGTIEFVQVRLVNFQHQVLIPWASAVLSPPQFSTTLPRESLGVTREGFSQC